MQTLMVGLLVVSSVLTGLGLGPAAMAESPTGGDDPTSTTGDAGNGGDDDSAPDDGTEPDDTGGTSEVDDLEPADVSPAIWIALAVVLLIAIGSAMAGGRSRSAEDPGES